MFLALDSISSHNRDEEHAWPMRLKRQPVAMAQVPLINAITLPSSPAHSGFLIWHKWEGVQKLADGRGIPPRSVQFPTTV